MPKQKARFEKTVLACPSMFVEGLGPGIIYNWPTNLEKEAGKEVHAWDSYNKQPRYLEYGCPKVNYSVVFRCPAQGSITCVIK